MAWIGSRVVAELSSTEDGHATRWAKAAVTLGAFSEGLHSRNQVWLPCDLAASPLLAFETFDDRMGRRACLSSRRDAVPPECFRCESHRGVDADAC